MNKEKDLITKEEYEKIKKSELEEACDIMGSLKHSKDKHILYRNRRGVTDIKNLLETSAELYGDKDLFRQVMKGDDHFTGISYKEVLEHVNSLGTALIEMGLKDKHIGIIGANSYEWCESYLAITGGTGVAVPLDKELNEEELKNIVIRGELQAVITDEKHYEKIKSIKASGETGIKYIINMNGEEDEDLNQGLISWIRLRSLGKKLLKEGNRKFLDTRIINTDLAVIFFTSGTTGGSKGVMLSSKNICFNVMIAQSTLKVVEDDVFFSILPIHHSYECTASFIETVYCGATLAFCRGLKYILKDMQEIRPTMFLGVPLMYENFYNKITKNIEAQGKTKILNTLFKINKVTKKLNIDVTKKAVKKITDTFGGRLHTMISGGAAIEPKILEFFNNIGITALQGYGLTECSPMIALNPDIPKFMKLKSAGRVLPFSEVKVVDKDSVGVGELCFRGPSVMMGYYKDPEATANAIKEGWFYSGDLGYVDEDGYIFITGRKKNVIITANGKNVFPEELEFYLARSPYILESMVWGNETKEKRGIYATIIPDLDNVKSELGEDYTKEDLKKLIESEVDKLNSTLAIFKKINKVIVRERDFEKTTAHKIKRFEEGNKKA